MSPLPNKATIELESGKVIEIYAPSPTTDWVNLKIRVAIPAFSTDKEFAIDTEHFADWYSEHSNLTVRQALVQYIKEIMLPLYDMAEKVNDLRLVIMEMIG